MYARLCKKLSKEAPNFEAKGSQTCTFNRLLLKKCQDEFRCRRQATFMWDHSDKPVFATEDYEQRIGARRKMVGNLRFIGELGKQEIINGEILHNCIQTLLEKKKHQTLVDLAEDIECLCQMMKTCGKLLDNPKAKNLMDQYFNRMVQLSVCQDLQSRIRFMLRDSIELRAAGWIPRKIAQQDGPRTIQQVREEAARDLGVYIAPPNSDGGMKQNGPLSPISSMNPFFHQGSSRTGMEDVFGALGAGSLGTGPGVISSQPDKFSYEANGYSSNGNAREQNYRQRNQQGGNNFNSNNFYPNKHFSIPNFNRQNVQNNHQSNYNNAANKDLPPRFMKMLNHGRSNGNSSKADDVSLRPTSSMLTKPKVSGYVPGVGQSVINHSVDSYAVLPITTQPPNQKPLPILMHKEAPIVIKQAPIDKMKTGKKDKGLSKAEYMQKATNVIEELMKDQNVDQAVSGFKAIKVPERFLGEAICTTLEALLNKEVTDSGREIGGIFLLKMRTENIIGHSKLIDGIKELLNLLENLMTEIPRAKSHFAIILNPLLSEASVTLTDIAELLEDGQHYPLFFLILQSLHKSQGKTGLLQAFNDSKVNVMNLLPEADRNKEKLADLLDDRELSFLCPLLRIQSDLWDAILENPSPHIFYKHIKSNVDQEHHTAPTFVNALFTVFVKYITQESTLQPNVDTTISPDKITTEKEKELLTKFKPVLLAFLHDRVKLQVVTLYALQVFAFSMNFPKGMLVRWFVNLYDLEIIEEEAFITWKEDINPDFPGKGKALFQVNQWLTWLQETEEDEEEDNDM